MTTNVRLPDDLLSVTGRRGKRAKIHPNQAITDVNAVNSPLLQLPPEIRQMILRIVVGDKLIHVFKHYHESDSVDYDSDSVDPYGRWTLARSLCVAKVFTLYKSSLNHVTAPRPSSVAEVVPYHQQTHEDCLSFFDPVRGSNYRILSGILRTSRDICGEALGIFWRTNRFCFEDASALEKFLCALKQVNIKNVLKHLTILYSFGIPDGDEWAQIRAPSSLSALRGLATLELRIELWKDMSSDEERWTAIKEGLEQLDDLRLLKLEEVSVTIAYGELVFRKPLERGELEAMANKLRRRLLDPDITPKEYLADSIGRLEMSLRNTESSIRIHTKQLQDLQQNLDAAHSKAKRTKVEINELQAILQRNNTAEIERVLQTDEGDISSKES